MVLDLRGVPCPLNFVRTRLKLERLAVGDHLEVWLDPGEPLSHVPESLTACGHRVCQLDRHPDGFYVLIAQRGSA